MWKLKKRCFTGIEKLVIVTPSHWLKHIVERSFLRGSDIRVIPNGVDLNTFNPRESDFRARHGIGEDQYMLLGVASRWTEQKGIDVWIRLAQELDDRFRVVLVGTDEQVEAICEANGFGSVGGGCICGGDVWLKGGICRSCWLHSLLFSLGTDSSKEAHCNRRYWCHSSACGNL